MKKNMFLISLYILSLVSCSTYKIEFNDESSIITVDSISSYYIPWSILDRGGISPSNFFSYGNSITKNKIANRDSINMILEELKNLKFKEDKVCTCELAIKVYIIFDYTYVDTLIEGYSTTMSRIFYMTNTGDFVDIQNHIMYKRNDRLIELLQIPPKDR